MILNDPTALHLAAHHRDFDAFTEKMIETHPHRFDAVFWSFFHQFIPPAPRQIVDFGTGPGLLLEDLAKRFPKTQRIIGVEAQPSMVRKAQVIAHSLGPQVGIIDLDLASGHIDALTSGGTDIAIASMVLHEMPIPIVLMDEVARVLKPGGIWIVADQVRGPLSDYFEGKRPETLDDFTHFSEHCRYTAEDWKWLLEQSGFDVLEWLLRRDGRQVLLAARRR